MQAEQAEKESETKRDRVRRLLIAPLQDAGFRHRKDVPADKVRSDLDRIADGLGYMSDRGLSVLAAALATKGEGSARCFWPCYATVAGLAEAFEPRPLEDVPELVRWFRSAAGRDALAGDRLVAEYLFWEKFKRPPVSVQDRQRVTARSADWASRSERVRDRIARGFEPFPGDGDWLAWYDDLGRRVRALVGDAA